MSYQSLVAFEGWTFIAQILNLFIQMYLFKKFLFKPIQNILAQRQQEVDTLYADADPFGCDACQRPERGGGNAREGKPRHRA